MRRGEVAGLRWSDVDLDASRVSPRRPAWSSTARSSSLNPRRPRAAARSRSTPPPWPPSASIPAEVVSERLGHASIAITIDTYGHVLPGLDVQAAGAVARLILGDADNESARPVGNPLATGPQGPRRRGEVKDEPAAQGWGDRGDSNPRPSGPQPDALTN
jgi:integrase